MENKKVLVPAWFIVGINSRIIGAMADEVDIEGPYFSQTAARMRLASFPGCKVERRMVEKSEEVARPPWDIRDGE